MSENIKLGIDAFSNSVTVAVIMGFLPVVTVILTFIWACFRLYETKTVQGWINARKDRKASK